MAKNYIVLYGKNPVFERLKANPRSIRKIFMQRGFDARRIKGLIESNNIPLERLSSRQLANMRPDKDLQGIIARIDRFEYTPFSTLLKRAQPRQPSFIFLDKINDPHNLGVIMRIAACFGGFALVIPASGACKVTETVLHVASGGENYVPVSIEDDLSGAIIAAKEHGCQIAGAVVDKEAKALKKAAFSFPMGLVLGSEGSGISRRLEDLIDLKTRIPMKGAGLSFNVSMACAIICYEITKQREGL